VPTCLLVRHGHSSANGQGVLAGRTPGVHLSERGLEQAAALAARFVGTPVARVVSSPMERCLETAAPIARAVGLDVTVHDGLQECGYGAWTGRPLAELAQEPLWRTVQDDPDSARFPDGGEYAAESLREMYDRVVATVREVDAEVAASDGAGAVWVAVSHGDLIKAVLAEATGSGLARFQRYTADPASLSVVRFGERHTFLLAANDVAPDVSRFRPPEAATDGTGISPADAVVGGGIGPDGVGDVRPVGGVADCSDMSAG
jgi:probable phosphomutase (TIGR03848 family)